MTDRELERRLRALYRTRVPVEEPAPLELRSELVAITEASTTARLGSSRAWTWLAAAALLGAMLVGGALIAGSGLLRSTAVVLPDVTAMPTSTASLAPATPEPPPHGSLKCCSRYLPGQYSWDLGSLGWLHKVPYGSGGRASVELSFRLTTKPNELEALAEALAADGDGPATVQPIEIPGLAVQTWSDKDGLVVGRIAPGERPPPAAVTSETTRTWMMDVGGRVVAIDMTTFTDTTAALFAEAEAVIRSVRVQRDAAATPAPSGYPPPFPGLKFELPSGWDSG